MFKREPPREPSPRLQTTTPPLVKDQGRAKAHVPDHFFQGICICPCINCTKSSNVGDRPYCVCPDCPPEPCGLRMKGM